MATASCLLAGLAACGDGATESQRLAQANVAAKERALSDAQAAQAAATAAFCSASTAYIRALDRYGDLLVATGPTVGDVTDAGADLAAPQADVAEGAQAAIAAGEAVTAAEQDLVQAKARLDSPDSPAESSQGTATDGSGGQTAKPGEVPAAVARVQQAQADFADAQDGISSSTSLVKAGVAFNSAAVALEVSWLSLLLQTGCLSKDAQKQAVAAINDYTLALHEDLAAAGYYEGELDGGYGPETVSAIKALQKAHELPQTGALDKATAAALRLELEQQGRTSAEQDLASTAALQQTLKLAGYWDGPIDGLWSAELTDALEQLQSDLGVKVTGTVDPATISAFEKAVRDALQPDTATATVTATATKTATATATATTTINATATKTATATATTTIKASATATAIPTQKGPTDQPIPSDTASD